MTRNYSLPILQPTTTRKSRVEMNTLNFEKKWWRSLDELAQTQEFHDYLHREFPENATDWLAGSRRDFLRLMGASLFLAGVTGCNIKQPPEKILPAARQTGHASPGLPLYFTTAYDFAGSAIGLTVQTRDGRPIKVEGNSLHPSSLGATSIFAQAATLDLYDPDRAHTPLHKNKVSTKQALRQELVALRVRLDEIKGRGLRILLGNSTSPTLARLLAVAKQRWPEMKWLVYEPINDDHVRDGLKTAFGDEAANVCPIYDFSQADVVLSIDADFLSARDYPPCYINQFASQRCIAGRESNSTAQSMVRLYHLGSTCTPTSAKADHPLAISPSQLPSVVAILANALNEPLQFPADASETAKDWIAKLVADLRTANGRGLVLVGREQPAEVHALAHRINDWIGAIGRTVTYINSPQVRPDQANTDLAMLNELVADINAGDVESLLMFNCNPVFDAPRKFDFENLLPNVEFTLTLTNAVSETSRRCNWLVPRSHFMEGWSDARGHDGTATIVQPLISPLHQSLSDIELLSLLCDDSASDYEAVRKTWKDKLGDRDDDARWQTAAANGVIPNTSSQAKSLAINKNLIAIRPQSIVSNQHNRLDIIIRPDPTVWDGRFVNNGWLQELPKPLTHLTWDNAAFIALADANKLNLQNGDIVSIGEAESQINVPVCIVPGHASKTITLFMGFGRKAVGRVGNATGFDIRPLIRENNATQLLSVLVANTNSTYQLATTQHYQSMDGKHLARAGSLREFLEQPDEPAFAHPPSAAPDASFYPDWPYDGHKWGMTIDLTACVGCSACVIACQAENNIPVVGKQQVLANRHMHWIRVDTYYTGSPEYPSQTLHQPVTCMHCERAPCEVVCPVAATNHDEEGLNQMIYNRCVGTRYCSNNCPYKVRRFNFLDFSDNFINDPTLHLLSNPEVTMRQRGVMEKCTYCIQRIENGRINAHVEDRELKDGDIKTACQTVCPAQAIRFGDLNDASSQVRITHDHPLNYILLEELNTKPRTTYLAEVTNPSEDKS